MIDVPAGLVAATAQREGAAGRRWLARLPDLVEVACRRWGCAVTGVPVHGEVALVVPVRHPSGPAVLKISFPHPGNLGEADALRAFGGSGAVRLLEVDESGLELVLEAARSRTLADHVAAGEVGAEEAVKICGDLARRLAVVPDRPVTALADTVPGWLAELDGQVAGQPDALPPAVVARARSTIEALGTESTPTMLHGDLHFGNVLGSEREPWLAVDPKGWTGTPAFDAFTVVVGGRERLGLDEVRTVLARRVQRFAAAAGVDAALALACCQARAVSSYLYQLDRPRNWFDAQLLLIMATDGAV